VWGVTGDVGGCGGVASRAGSGAGRTSNGVTGCGVGYKRGGARLAHRDLTTRPGTTRFDCFPWPVVFRVRVLLLEVWEHVFGAVSGPESQ